MDTQTKKLVISGAAFSVGTFAMYEAVQASDRRGQEYLNNGLRAQVNKSCGVQLTDDQWRNFTRTAEWRRFQAGLPHYGTLETIRNLMGPTALFSVGSLFAGVALDIALSAFVDIGNDWGDINTWIAVGFTFGLLMTGRLWFLNRASQAFIKLDDIPADSSICLAARSISQPAVITGFAAVGQEPAGPSPVYQAVYEPAPLTTFAGANVFASVFATLPPAVPFMAAVY